ncbi:MAG: hypothetical protein RL347_1793, partial [Actinomycetota bacterium]
TLRVTVADDGRGLPDDVDEGLGLQIVRSLVEQDLHGTLTMGSASTNFADGCEVSVEIQADASRGSQ